MHTIRTLYKTSRPHLWLYLLGPFMIGSIILIQETTANNIGWVVWFLLYMLFPANLFIYGVNDLYDAETDALNEKKQGYESQVQNSRILKKSIYLSQLPWIATLPFIPLRAAGVFALFLFFGFFYSATPIRAKAIPFLDSLFNILYVLPGFFIVLLAPTLSIPLPVIIASWTWCIAMHTYSAIPDIQADTQAGIATTATLLGKNGALLYCTSLWLIAAFFAQPFFGFSTMILFVPYAALCAISARAQHPAQLLFIYKQFPYVNTIIGMVVYFSILL